jgi:hypothetical protein
MVQVVSFAEGGGCGSMGMGNGWIEKEESLSWVRLGLAVERASTSVRKETRGRRGFGFLGEIGLGLVFFSLGLGARLCCRHWSDSPGRAPGQDRTQQRVGKHRTAGSQGSSKDGRYL